MQLGYRFAHVLRRMLPIAMFLLQRDGQFLNGHDLFLKRVGSTYHAFLESAERECRNKCLEDLQSTTRYVTWSLHTKSRTSLKSMLNRVRPPHLRAPLGAAALRAMSGAHSQTQKPPAPVRSAAVTAVPRVLAAASWGGRGPSGC